MKQLTASPHYLHIAHDIAIRIANGELKEGDKIYGRSVMASEYNVSPETIRRALKLLADMKVVDIKPQSGATVLSADGARRYIKNYLEASSVQRLRLKLKELVEESEKTNQRILEVADELMANRSTYLSAKEPLPNYEVEIPEGSMVIGKSVGGLKFWQSTGCTIVAIRRGRSVILSPGPYAELYEKDVLIIVGTVDAVDIAVRFIRDGISL